MILNTGSRTDIPAFYYQWFYNRIKQGYVMVRNPVKPEIVYKYMINKDVIDIITFCSKNPGPMLSNLSLLDDYKTFWYITLTGYGKDIEPNIKDKQEVINSIKVLSKYFGKDCIGLRYDPIFINSKYTVAYHLQAFETIVKQLSGYIGLATFSFIDLYEKTKRNFKEVKAVDIDTQRYLAKNLKQICLKYNLDLYSCCEGNYLQEYGINTQGCMSKQVLEKACHIDLKIPTNKVYVRETCNCLLGNDIGEYNTCLHGCKYCYANYDNNIVYNNYKKHDVNSPLLIGNVTSKDKIIEAKQKSFKDIQLRLF